jgi:hypothetical protein
MSDSTAKTRHVCFVCSIRAVAMALSSAFISCANGGGTPTAFSDDNTPASYDAATGGTAAEAVSATDAADDESYGSASCAVPSPDDSADASDDADADDGSSAGVTPSIGDLVITEIMFDPTGPVPEAQWFEVYNLTGEPEFLNGLTIEDSWGDAQTISSTPPVIAPPFTYVVLVRDMATALSNGIPGGSIVYEYGAGQSSYQGIELASDWTGDLSLWNGGQEIVDVPYGDWGMAYTGDSIELASLQFVGADQPGNWCVAQVAWAAGTDFGTPGLASDCF